MYIEIPQYIFRRILKLNGDLHFTSEKCLASLPHFERYRDFNKVFQCVGPNDEEIAIITYADTRQVWIKAELKGL